MKKTNQTIKFIMLTADEDNLIQELLMHEKAVDFLTVQEFITLSNLRKKFNLPEIKGIDNNFVKKYGNCFKGSSIELFD